MYLSFSDQITRIQIALAGNSRSWLIINKFRRLDSHTFQSQQNLKQNKSQRNHTLLKLNCIAICMQIASQSVIKLQRSNLILKSLFVCFFNFLKNFVFCFLFGIFVGSLLQSLLVHSVPVSVENGLGFGYQNSLKILSKQVTNRQRGFSFSSNHVRRQEKERIELKIRLCHILSVKLQFFLRRVHLASHR